MFVLNGSDIAASSAYPKQGPRFLLQQIAFDLTKHGKDFCLFKLKINDDLSFFHSSYSGDDHSALVKPPMQSPS